VHVEGAPSLDPAIYELGVPIFGICYGTQLIAQQLGGEVGRGMRGEYGRAKLEVTDGRPSCCTICHRPTTCG
jgi:GMP synthase (glutamine-hydrolysing)